MSDGALICTLNSVDWGSNCNKCDTWRMLVWQNGAHEHEQGYSSYNSLRVSTKAGKYYGGHNPCRYEDNFPLCGEWGKPSGKYRVI